MTAVKSEVCLKGLEERPSPFATTALSIYQMRLVTLKVTVPIDGPKPLVIV